MVVGARQSFHFFIKKAWFLENNRIGFNFYVGLLN